MLSLLLLLLLLPSSPLILAQTFTTCNPLNTTCPANPALGTTLSETFNASTKGFNSDLWTIDAGVDLIKFGDDGAELPLGSAQDTVTLQSNFYIFWGTVEFIMKASPGQGLISTVILLSQDLDEIDWEVKGTNTTSVSNNWYGWGNLSQFNSEYPSLSSPQTEYHNYTIDWNAERILYYLDSNIVRTVPAAAPGLYPQTPSRVQFGTWCGGCSKSPGTVEWAGGKPDWTGGPYTMYVKSLRVVDGTTGASEYSYGDRTGSAASIKVVEGESTASKHLTSSGSPISSSSSTTGTSDTNSNNSNNNTSTTTSNTSDLEKLSKKWSHLSTGAKIGIGSGLGSVLLLAVIAFFFYCLRQRKAGRLEAQQNEEKWAEQNAELMEYRTMMAKGNFAVSRQSILMMGDQGRDERREERERLVR